jgi:hypothetical protein
MALVEFGRSGDRISIRIETKRALGQAIQQLMSGHHNLL